MIYKRLSTLYKAVIAIWFIFMANSFSLSASHAVVLEDKGPEPYRILALGDSLTAGYGLPTKDGFVPQLSSWINAQGLDQKIIITNAGVSGDTTQGGRSRLAWSLAPFGKKGPDLVIVALGGNDGLRGVNPAITRENMTAIVKELKKRGIKTMLLGMLAPPNLGDDYAREFNTIYTDLSKAYGLVLYPFFLDGVAAIKDLNQKDGIHPNKEGVTVIVNKVGPVLKKVITSK